MPSLADFLLSFFRFLKSESDENSNKIISYVLPSESDSYSLLDVISGDAVLLKLEACLIFKSVFRIVATDIVKIDSRRPEFICGLINRFGRMTNQFLEL